MQVIHFMRYINSRLTYLLYTLLADLFGCSCVITAPPGELNPRFTWTPLTMMDSLLGDTVTLECAAEAWPVPRVTWQRHGGLLPVNRHRYVLGQSRDALSQTRSRMKTQSQSAVCNAVCLSVCVSVSIN